MSESNNLERLVGRSVNKGENDIKKTAQPLISAHHHKQVKELAKERGLFLGRMYAEVLAAGIDALKGKQK